jgi:hypothetical protein
MRDWLAAIRRQQKEAEELRGEISALDAKRAKKAAKLGVIEKRLKDALAILHGEQPEKPKSRHGFVGGKRAKPIQYGSSVWWTAKVLFLVGKPMHVSKLLERITQESGETFLKNTLVSNLSRYVRYGDTFNRPAPNTFGLIDFDRDVEAVRAEGEPVPREEEENAGP